MSLRCVAAIAVSPKGTQMCSDSLGGHHHLAHHAGGQQGATPRRCGCWRSAPAASCWPQPQQKARRCCGALRTWLCWGRCPHRQRQLATAAAAVRPRAVPSCSLCLAARHCQNTRRQHRWPPRIARRSSGSGASTVRDHCRSEMYRSGTCPPAVVCPSCTSCPYMSRIRVTQRAVVPSTPLRSCTWAHALLCQRCQARSSHAGRSEQQPGPLGQVLAVAWCGGVALFQASVVPIDSQQRAPLQQIAALQVAAPVAGHILQLWQLPVGGGAWTPVRLAGRVQGGLQESDAAAIWQLPVGLLCTPKFHPCHFVYDISRPLVFFLAFSWCCCLIGTPGHGMTCTAPGRITSQSKAALQYPWRSWHVCRDVPCAAAGALSGLCCRRLSLAADSIAARRFCSWSRRRCLSVGNRPGAGRR